MSTRRRFVGFAMAGAAVAVIAAGCSSETPPADPVGTSSAALTSADASVGGADRRDDEQASCSITDDPTTTATTITLSVTLCDNDDVSHHARQCRTPVTLQQVTSQTRTPVTLKVISTVAVGAETDLVVSSSSANGTTTTSIVYGPAFHGIHDSLFTSDGTTVTGNVDGRAIVPYPRIRSTPAPALPGWKSTPGRRCQPALDRRDRSSLRRSV